MSLRATPQRDLRACAARAGARLDVIECVCSEENARERLERDRELGAHPARDRDFGLYQKLEARMQRIAFAHLTLATDSRTPDDLAAAVLVWISARDGEAPLTSSGTS